MYEPITPHEYRIEASRQRSCGLDVVRCCAILFVVAGHFFLNTPFNNTPFSSGSMFILGMLQTLMLINVPLFLMLTGYLNLNKQVNRKYYRNGIRVVVSYVVISIITILYRKYYLGDTESWGMWVRKILDFSAIPYAWYIEMWIGLFLLTPFLNILWKNIGSRRHKHVLLLSLYLLTALPDFFNRYGLSLVPGYWEVMYPVTFFYLGAYIREYQPKLNDSVRIGRRTVSIATLCIAGIIGICLINPVINIVLFGHRPMLHLVGDGNGIFGVPLATLFFIAVYRTDWKNKGVKSVLAKVSVLSLDMYLFSWIFDSSLYPLTRAWMPDMQSWLILLYYVAVVASVFLLSFIAAAIKDGVRRLI